MRIPNNKERNLLITKCALDGYTLKQVGTVFGGLTSPRIMQIISTICFKHAPHIYNEIMPPPTERQPGYRGLVSIIRLRKYRNRLKTIIEEVITNVIHN